MWADLEPVGQTLSICAICQGESKTNRHRFSTRLENQCLGTNDSHSFLSQERGLEWVTEEQLGLGNNILVSILPKADTETRI